MQLPEVTRPVDNAHWAIEGVPAKHAASAWRRCWELLRPAAEYFPLKRPFQEIEVYEAVKRGDMQLWVAWSYDRRRIEGVVLTRTLIDPPGMPGRVFDIILCGGVNFREWVFHIFALLKSWARAEGAHTIISG